MKPSPMTTDAASPDEGLEAMYSLDLIAELAGVTTQTIVHYQEIALLSPGPQLDVEDLRQLRRIEYLRMEHELNDDALKLMLSLLDEVERLRQEVRRMRR